MKDVTWKIGGEAGFGIMTTGQMFSRIAIKHGYKVFDYTEYPSLIRGGHNVYEVRISDDEVFSQEKKVDFLFALNKETFNLHKDELKDGAIVVYDRDSFEIDDILINAKNVIFYPLSLAEIIREIGGQKVMENNVALGATIAIFSMDIEVIYSIIESIFEKKGQEIIDKNKAAAKAGYKYVLKNFPKKFSIKLPKISNYPQILATGNEAAGMGAIAGGCQLYVAYPMTPTTAILHFMAAYGPKYGVVVKHAEDEISVINMAIGAGYAGVRSMVATAGGGFSLMVEGLGLAGITETPIVIVEGQRPGPATGMPTWTSQGDLQFIIHAAQDEFPRIILTPGDINETFFLTSEAFNLAEIYQTPVLVMVDKFLAESRASVPVFDLSKIKVGRGKLLSFEQADSIENYLRYKVTPDGIPDRSFPGTKKAVFVANSYEHDEFGWSTEESEERIKQVDRRARKIGTYEKTIPKQNLYGVNEADLTVVAWGSSKGPILQAMKELKDENSDISVNFLHITHAWPFPVASVSEVLKKANKTLLVEGNSYGQMGLLIREQTGIELKNKYLRYDGRPFYPEDIKNKIQEVLKIS